MLRWLPQIQIGGWGGVSIDDTDDDFEGRYLVIQWGRFQLEISAGRRRWPSPPG